MPYIETILSFLTWQVISLAEAEYSLEILVLGYQNPTHSALGYDGACCEKGSWPCDLCDNAFRFCIRETITMMTQGACDLAKFETNKIASNNDNLTFSLGDIIGGYTNPFIVSGERWPVSGLLKCVYVWVKRKNGVYLPLYIVLLLANTLYIIILLLYCCLHCPCRERWKFC